MSKIRIVREAGEYHVGAEFEIDEQVARQLKLEGVAEILADAPAPRHEEVVKPKRVSKHAKEG